jgi:ribosomal protein L20A (L18A)
LKVRKKLQRYVINIQRMREAKNNELKEEVVKNFRACLVRRI